MEQIQFLLGQVSVQGTMENITDAVTWSQSVRMCARTYSVQVGLREKDPRKESSDRWLKVIRSVFMGPRLSMKADISTLHKPDILILR